MKCSFDFEMTVNGRRYTAVKTKMNRVYLSYEVYAEGKNVSVGVISKLNKQDEQFRASVTNARIPGHIELAVDHNETYRMNGLEVNVHGTCNYNGMHELDFCGSMTGKEIARKKICLYAKASGDLSECGIGDISVAVNDIESGIEAIDMLANSKLSGLTFCEYEYDRLRSYYSREEMELVFGQFSVSDD